MVIKWIRKKIARRPKCQCNNIFNETNIMPYMKNITQTQSAIATSYEIQPKVC